MVSVHLHFLLTESGKEVGSDFSLPAAFVCVSVLSEYSKEVDKELGGAT